MKKEDIVAYANRPWHLLEAADTEHWLARKREGGPMEGIRLGDELRALARLARPEWPTPEERHDDLQHHARLSEILRSVTFPPPR